MNEKSFGLIGANGKMGKEISSLLKEYDYECVFKYDLDGEVLNSTPKILIDFSLPEVFENTIKYVYKFN